MQKYSEFELTGNKAMDIIAEAIGHAKTYGKTIKYIKLSRTYYALLMAGVEIKSQTPLPEAHHMLFEGTSILQGGMFDDNITVEYATKKEIRKARKN
jgi:hypothetical protein